MASADFSSFSSVTHPAISRNLPSVEVTQSGFIKIGDELFKATLIDETGSEHVLGQQDQAKIAQLAEVIKEIVKSTTQFDEVQIDKTGFNGRQGEREFTGDFVDTSIPKVATLFISHGPETESPQLSRHHGEDSYSSSVEDSHSDVSSMDSEELVSSGMHSASQAHYMLVRQANENPKLAKFSELLEAEKHVDRHQELSAADKTNISQLIALHQEISQSGDESTKRAVDALFNKSIAFQFVNAAHRVNGLVGHQSDGEVLKELLSSTHSVADLHVLNTLLIKYAKHSEAHSVKYLINTVGAIFGVMEQKFPAATQLLASVTQLWHFHNDTLVNLKLFNQEIDPAHFQATFNTPAKREALQTYMNNVLIYLHNHQAISLTDLTRKKQELLEFLPAENSTNLPFIETVRVMDSWVRTRSALIETNEKLAQIHPQLALPVNSLGVSGSLGQENLLADLLDTLLHADSKKLSLEELDKVRLALIKVAENQRKEQPQVAAKFQAFVHYLDDLETIFSSLMNTPIKPSELGELQTPLLDIVLTNELASQIRQVDQQLLEPVPVFPTIEQGFNKFEANPVAQRAAFEIKKGLINEFMTDYLERRQIAVPQDIVLPLFNNVFQYNKQFDEADLQTIFSENLHAVADLAKEHKLSEKATKDLDDLFQMLHFYILEKQSS